MQNMETDSVKEIFLHARKTHSEGFYLVLVITVLAAVICLPFVYIDISVGGRGIIRPVQEKTEIKAIYPEIVERVLISEGQKVSKNDTLVVLRHQKIDDDIRFVRQEMDRMQNYRHDLELLLSESVADTDSIKTGLYAGQNDLFRKKNNELYNKIIKVRHDVSRNRRLLADDLITVREAEESEFQYKQLVKEQSSLLSDQFARWNDQLVQVNQKFANLENQLAAALKEKDLYIIKSPVSGTVEQFSGFYEGSVCQAGQSICLISPETNLVAEVYLSAKDIGLIQVNQQTFVQVDAFNYNQWGVLNGHVQLVANDYMLTSAGVPVFKVSCSLERHYLELGNGVTGQLKKGMTVNTRFVVARRSLLQLLYQRTDDWFNPSRSLANINQSL